MYHSITFIDVDDTSVRRNTLEDWHIMPSSRPIIAPPKVQTKYVDLPGADGSIDLTEYLAGRPTFSDREGTIELLVLNNYNIDGYDYDWPSLYSDLMAYLHGWRKIMILEDDPNYYYTGRFSLDSWAVDQYNSKVTVGYKLWPYKCSSYYILSDEFEAGGYNVTSHIDPMNIDQIKGPKKNDSISGYIRQKTTSKPRFMKSGTVISFSLSDTSQPTSYSLIPYRFDTNNNYWISQTPITDLGTYTLANDGYYRFSVYSGGSSFVENYKDIARAIKFDYEPDEVL